MVFYISLIIILFMIAFGLFFPGALATLTSNLFETISLNLDWLYLVSVFIVLGFSIYLMFSRFGNLRLGKPTDRPEYSNFSWFAMLFSAGMGIGLVFWGIAEPLKHYSNPPLGIEAYSNEAAYTALRYSFLHWGFHPWAIYSIVGLGLAYVTFKKEQPCLISSIIQPLFKKNVIIGNIVDILSLLVTVIGVATSLGMGALQVSGGLAHVTGLPNNITTQIIIIIIITGMFLISAATGIEKGIKILSNINIVIALFLLMFLFFTGPISLYFKLFFKTLAEYVQNIIQMSFSLTPLEKDPWLGQWTVFYWAWWISWGPFVGTFIARISKGRTIKEFVFGVLTIPATFCLIWFTIFGGTALNLQINQSINIAEFINQDVTTGLFITFSYLPFSQIISYIAILLIVTFFVTSADSATFVIAMYSRKGDINPDNKIKLIWGVLLSMMSIALLFSGGLPAMQSMSIIMALPFVFILILICISIYKELNCTIPK